MYDGCTRLKGDVSDGRGFQWTADEDLELLRVTLAVGVVAVESTNSQTHKCPKKTIR